MDMAKSLWKFYEAKSHDLPGGEMFRIYDRVAHLGNWWGRSKPDLRLYLINKQVNFTRIEALIQRGGMDVRQSG